MAGKAALDFLYSFSTLLSHLAGMMGFNFSAASYPASENHLNTERPDGKAAQIRQRGLTMLLNLFTFIVIPVYTLLFAGNFNLFTFNFSVIGNLLGRKRVFALWGILAGAFYYSVLSSVSCRLNLPKPVRRLTDAALLFLFFAVATPYLPDELPFKSFLHIVFALISSLCLILYLYFASERLFRLDRQAGSAALWSLGAILSVSASLLLSVGIISSALEIFFTFSTVFLSRFLLAAAKRSPQPAGILAEA